MNHHVGNDVEKKILLKIAACQVKLPMFHHVFFFNPFFGKIPSTVHHPVMNFVVGFLQKKKTAISLSDTSLMGVFVSGGCTVE
jgi:hypothetical protein